MHELSSLVHSPDGEPPPLFNAELELAAACEVMTCSDEAGACFCTGATTVVGCGEGATNEAGVLTMTSMGTDATLFSAGFSSDDCAGCCKDSGAVASVVVTGGGTSEVEVETMMEEVLVEGFLDNS